MNGINVSSVDFGIMSRERKLQLSKGEVLIEGSPTMNREDKIRLDFPADGLFSEKIFGYSADSRREDVTTKFTESLPERSRNFGHMKLCVPYVVPYLYGNNGSKINLILGMKGSRIMREIINWNAALVRVEKGSELFEHFKMDRPKGTVETEIQEIDILSAYMLKSSERRPDPDRPGEYKTVDFAYFSVPLQTFKDKSQHGKGTNFKKFNSLAAIGSANTGANVFMGGFAILHLLSQLDINDELIFISHKLGRLRSMVKDADTENKKKNALQEYKQTTERYNILLNFKRRGTNLADIVSDIFLIQPAGLRDVSLRVDSNGITTPTTPKINEQYKHLINTNNKLSKFGSLVTPEEIMQRGVSDLSWSRNIPTQETFIRDARQIQERANEIILRSIAGKIGKKHGRFRQAVLSKRLDYSAIAVITPNPTLKLDEIAVPIQILKKWMEGILEDSTSSKVPKAELMSFLKNYNKMEEDMILEEMMGEDNATNYLDGNIKVGFTEISESDSNRISILKQLEQILSNFRVTSTRFPSLHKYNTMGYRIVISYNNTTGVHPLVCTHYNADFDGDQMSLALIQTPEAVREVDQILLPSKNLINTSGRPLISPTQDAVLGAYYMTLDLNKDKGTVRVFHSFDEMFRAFELKQINLHDRVSVGIGRYNKSYYLDQFRGFKETEDSIKGNVSYSGLKYSTLSENEFESFLSKRVNTYETVARDDNELNYVESTVGRFIFDSCLPQDLGFVDRGKDEYKLELEGVLEELNSAGLTSKNLDIIISRVIESKPLEEVKYILDMIKHKGYKYATLSGMSMSLQDIYTHPDKKGMVAKSMKIVNEVDRQERDGEISKSEAYQRRIAEWQKTNDDLADKTMEFLPDDNPIKMMSVSGSRGSKTQITQLMGMRGLMADTSSNIIETPVTSSFLEGMSMTEYFTASYGTRKGIFDRSNRTKETGESTRTSVYGAEKMVVVDGDCGDTEGILMTQLIDDDGKLEKTLMDRIKGKFLLEDLQDEEGKVLVKKGIAVMTVYKDLEDKYKGAGIRVRSPLSCKHRLGICAKCYGYNYGSNRFAKIGDAAGVLAAQTIGEPGTQLTMRTFHTGGVAKGDITQGFSAVRNLLESNNKYPPRLAILLESAGNVNDDEMLEQQQNVIIRLDKLNEESKNKTVVKEGLTFYDYGIVNADLYISMMNELKRYLQISYQSQGVDILDAHYEVIARIMGGNFRVEDQGDSVHVAGDVISWADVESNNTTLVEKGLRPVMVSPTITSLKEMAMGPSNPFTAMTFQNMNKILTTAISSQGRDDLTNPMSSIMVSNVLATGEGNRRYMHKKKTRYQDIQSNQELMAELGVPMYTEEEEMVEEVVESKLPGIITDEEIVETIDPGLELEWGTTPDSGETSVVDILGGMTVEDFNDEFADMFADDENLEEEQPSTIQGEEEDNGIKPTGLTWE